MVEVAGSLGTQLGAALRTERFLRSTSQRALARELGVSKSFIGRLESGDLRGSAAAVARLVEQLGLAVAIVVPDEDLGSAVVDDSPLARRLADAWRDAATDERVPADDHPTDEHDPAGQRPAGERPAGERPAGERPAGERPNEDHTAGECPTGSGGCGRGHRDEVGTDGTPLTCGRALRLPPPPDGPPRRPTWLVSSRGLEELVVPGQPPLTGLVRRVVVGVPAAGRSLRMDRFYDDPGVRTVAASWLRRAEAEQVRDAAGRRLPAHVVCFPVQLPRTWWYCRHVGWSWTRRPVWSWRREPLWEVEAALTGPNPPPVGAHPDGGWPMQGRPSEETRGDWPPDPSRRRLRPGAATR